MKRIILGWLAAGLLAGPLATQAAAVTVVAREWLALEQATVADLACYPYVALAAEGGIDTRSFTAVQDWQARVEALPGFWPMARIPGLAPVPLVPPP